MPDLNIRDVPEELMTNLRVYAASKGKSLKEVVLALLSNLTTIQRWEENPTAVILEEAKKRGAKIAVATDVSRRRRNEYVLRDLRPSFNQRSIL